MKDAKDLIPWQVTDISIRPYDGFWSFNPSLHFDGEVWRAVLRCADYAMPDGITIRSKKTSGGQQTKNAMVIFDPKTWKPIQTFKMHEKDDLPREACPHVGFEDMRLFRTDKGGLQGIAASLHLRRGHAPRASDTRPQHQKPEQVILSFDESYNIVHAHPIRGDGFSSSPQKNWVPFDNAVEPRFLYSIDKGTLYGDDGPLRGDDAVVTMSALEPRKSIGSALTPSPEGLFTAWSSFADIVDASAVPAPREPIREKKKKSSSKRHNLGGKIRGGDVQIRGRVKYDTTSARPSARPVAARNTPPVRTDDGVRMMGSGRMLLPKYGGLRGGTQLVRVADDTWLGIAHEMKFVNGRKFYWHIVYTVNSRGKVTAVSEDFKMASEGIEFAAGLGIDGDRMVVSFGVDDMHCRLGETRLSAVMEILRSNGRGR